MKKSFLYILSFCIVSSNLYSMEEGCDSPNNNRVSEFIIKNRTSEVPVMNPDKEEVGDESLVETSDSDNDTTDALEFAPQKVRDVVQLIKTDKKSRALYKCLILTGPAGTGKTLLAKRICEELYPDRPIDFILSSGLLKHVRNKTSEDLEKKFLDWKKAKKPRPILIFDEIMALFEGYASEHNDSQTTSRTFWQYYDKYKRYKDFFFIGIANSTDMDIPLLSRLRERIFVVSEVDLDNRVKMLQKKIDAFSSNEKDETINEAFLNEFAEQLKDFSYRDIGTLVLKAHRISYGENPIREKILFSKKYFEMALAEWKEENKTIINMERKEPAEDRRHKESMEQHERHHQQSAQQNQQQHQQNQEQQREYFWNNCYFQIGFAVVGCAAGGFLKWFMDSRRR